jgi:hypothetical protein
MLSLNKRLVFTLVTTAIILGIAFLIVYSQKNSSYQTKTYHDEKYGFSVDYPTNWKAEVLNESKIGTRLPYLYFSGPKSGFTPSVSIDIDSNTSVDDWMKANTLKEIPDSQPKIVREFTIGSRKAFQFEGDAGDGGTWHSLVVVIPPNLIDMHSSYTLEDEKQTFDLMMNSFQVTK